MKETHPFSKPLIDMVLVNDICGEFCRVGEIVLGRAVGLKDLEELAVTRDGVIDGILDGKRLLCAVGKEDGSRLGP